MIAAYRGHLHTSGVTRRSMACGGLDIAASGRPVLGEELRLTLGNLGTDVGGFLLGSPAAALPVCFGCAGTYNLLQPELAGALRERKLSNIASVKPDLIATGNIGCIAQLERGSAVPIVHTVELLDWATGGPCPKGLEHLQSKVHPIESLTALAGAR
jgi:hypothetical protein